MGTEHDRKPEHTDEGRHDDKTEPAGTIPNEEDGVGLTSDDESTSFEPEEDPQGASEETGSDDGRP